MPLDRLAGALSHIESALQHVMLCKHTEIRRHSQNSRLTERTQFSSKLIGWTDLICDRLLVVFSK